jgi:hypothetical protein
VAGFGDADALKSIMLRIFTSLYSFSMFSPFHIKSFFLFITIFLSINSIFEVFYKVLCNKSCVFSFLDITLDFAEW